MTDPNTPTTPSSNPQDLIDQALGGTPTPAVMPDPTPAVTEPTLPTPEPLTPPVAVVEVPPMSTEPVLPPAETVPTELTSTPVTPMMEEPLVDTKPMGEDMPLAFATAASVDTTPTKAPETYIEPVNSSAVVPPILTTPASDSSAPKKKSKSKILAVVAGFFLLFASIGIYAYDTYGDPITIAGVTIGKNGRPSEIDNKEDCDGESNGGWLVWRNGSCKVTGSSGSEDKNNDGVGDKDTTNPNDKTDEANTESQCGSAGGVWCDYGFCIPQTSTKGCNAVALERGYMVTTGANVVSCGGSHASKCTCGNNKDFCFDKTGYCGYESEGTSDQTKLSSLCAITTSPLWTVSPNCDKTNKLDCPAIPTTTTNDGTNDGIADWFNKVNKTGNTTYYCDGMTENVSVGCNTLAAAPTNLKCFCGTIQVDTPTGFESRTMKCGCGGKDNPNPSTPTITTNPTLMCSSLTRTPTTTPAVGDKVTFTCVGASTPAGAVSLTYKFRYSLNSGAYLNLVNKTATTSELAINSCGSYKVQCQACGTINGVITCDPVWTGATTQ